MPDLDEPHLHQLTVGEIFKHLGTREGGLSPEEAQQRLSRYGSNVLEEPTRYSLIRGFLHQFTHFLAILLWIAAALAFTAEFMKPGEGMATLGWAILGVIVINALFAFFQEIIPQCRDQSRGAFDDRSFQLCDLGFGQVSNGQVGHRSFGRGEDGGRGGFRKNAGSKKSSGGSGVLRVIDRESHASQLRDRLFHDEDGAGGDRRDLPGDAPQQESLNVAQPAGSDEDEIGLHPLRLSRDCSGQGPMG